MSQVLGAAPNWAAERAEAARTVEPLSAADIVGLRELLGKQKRWWRDYNSWVPLLAFALSLVTATISAWVGYRKDIHDQQAQLAAQTQLFQELSAKYAEMQGKANATPSENNVLGLIVAQANTVLQNATDLALDLGTKATTAELATLGQAQLSLGRIKEAERLFKSALEAARTANDASMALRRMGTLEIVWSTSQTVRERGMGRFRKAMNLEKEYPPIVQVPGAVAFLKALAAFDLAGVLAGSDCDQARRWFAAGTEALVVAPPIPDIEILKRNAQAQMANGIGQVPGCRPA